MPARGWTWRPAQAAAAARAATRSRRRMRTWLLCLGVADRSGGNKGSEAGVNSSDKLAHTAGVSSSDELAQGNDSSEQEHDCTEARTR